MSSDARPLIEVSGLHIDYGDVAAVRGVDLRVDAGEIVVLLGANGAGKTSTIESIEGYRQPTSGTIRVLGAGPAAAMSSGFVGVQLQDDGMAPSARVSEVIDLFRSLQGSLGPSTDELLDLTGLRGRARGTVRKLSGGEHRRLAVAIALVGRPELLVLDEPTAGVDVGGRASIIELLKNKRDQGVGILVSTHEMAVATEIADRVIILHLGRVVGEGTIAELLAPRAHQIRFKATPQPDPVSLSSHLGTQVTTDGQFTVVHAERTNKLLTALLQWCTASSVSLGDIDDGGQTLEDIIVALTTGLDGE